MILIISVEGFTWFYPAIFGVSVIDVRILICDDIRNSN